MIRFDRYPGGKRYAATFSYDDGARADRRLVELFNKYSMKATFNLISRNIERETTDGIKPSELPSLYAGHEIACHSYTHPHLERMNITDQFKEIAHDRELLESWTGRIIRGMAYPFGTYSDDTFTAMKAAGIVYSRNVSSTGGFNPPADFFEWTPTTHHNESEQYVDKFIYNVTKATWRAGGILYIWGHSYEFDKEEMPVRWEKFEELLKKLYEHSDGIWFATNIEIYDYLDAVKRVRLSYDGTRVYNPTDTDIWASVDGNDNVLLPAGKETAIK